MAQGNEEWTTSLETKGIVAEKKAWHPWFTDEVKNMPAGYATTYNVTGAPYDFRYCENAYLSQCHFILKTIILPSQARDKHRNKLRKQGVF